MKSYDGTDFHILLVDDEEDIRQIYTARLKRQGFRVSTAHRADEAMKVLVSDKVDFIISDVKMPGASGFDLLSLSKIYESEIPVALISGHLDIETMNKEGRQSLHCFQKPFDFKDLLAVIDGVVNLKASA